MWHASIMPRLRLSLEALDRTARNVLAGVGDPTLGEWTEHGAAYHLRRRLSTAEAALVGPVVDVRGTFEAQKRLSRVAHLLPRGWEE